MSSKLTPINITLNKIKDFNNLKLDEILCQVCLSVLVEPVFLPCQHGFCLNCINCVAEKSTLNCPCCRKRFGNWYRYASKENNLVHKRLWVAIQNQFGEHFDNFGDESHPSIAISEPGEIKKDFESQLQKFQEELDVKEQKENVASSNYIIDLYKKERIINLDSEESNQSESEVEEENTTDISMLVAGPSHSSSFQQYAVPAATSRPETSKSIISISSTSSAASASSSSSSSRYSLIKSVAQQINRGTEIIKQTFLSKLTPAKLQQHEKLTKSNLNISELCVKPRNIHKAPSRCSSEGDDSLKEELNHFKPIFPTSPKRSISSKNVLRIPSVKPDQVSSNLGCYSPSKSPFKPIDPLTPRRSAFSIVNLSMAFINEPPEDEEEEEKKPESKNNDNDKKRATKRKLSPAKPKKAPKTPKKESVKAAKKSSPATATVTSGTTTRVTRRSNNNNTDTLNCNVLKEIILDQKKCEEIIEQERRDFEFAQKLQNRLNRTQPAPIIHSNTYSLRRKSNIQNEEHTVLEKKNLATSSTFLRRSARNKC